MEILPGVWQLELPMPFELRHVNVYVLHDGDGFTLIDTGLKTDEARAALLEHVRGLGIELSRITRILVTHIHPDHFGLAGELRERTGATLVIHRLEVALMEPRYARSEDLVTEVGRWLDIHGVPASAAEFLKTASLAAREYASVVEPDTLLEGAEHLSLGESGLLAVWTPGHSPGHSCFYWPHRRLLFSGDHLLPRISPNIGLHPQSSANPLDDYLDSLNRIAALEVDLVLPAHGPTFRGHRERVAEIQQHHGTRKAELLRQAQGEPQTGWELTGRLFPGIMDRSVFHQRLALQETLAHCQSLAQDGRLQKWADRGTVHWTAGADGRKG